MIIEWYLGLGLNFMIHWWPKHQTHICDFWFGFFQFVISLYSHYSGVFKWWCFAGRSFSKQSFSWINYCLMLHTFWRETLQTSRTQMEKWKRQSIFVLSLQTITFKTSSNVAIKFLTWCFALNAVCLCVWDEILNFVWHFQDLCTNHAENLGLFKSMPEEDYKTS